MKIIKNIFNIFFNQDDITTRLNDDIKFEQYIKFKFFPSLYLVSE